MILNRANMLLSSVNLIAAIVVEPSAPRGFHPKEYSALLRYEQALLVQLLLPNHDRSLAACGFRGSETNDNLHPDLL